MQYSYIPKYLSFQGQIRPQRAYVKMREASTGVEQKSSDYWILPGSAADPRISRDVDPSNPQPVEDLNVAFSQEQFSGKAFVVKDPATGQLIKKEIVVEIFVSSDMNGTEGFSLLKQINMNLAQFVDTGKIDDVISFQDIGVLYVFEMEVTQIFNDKQ